MTINQVLLAGYENLASVDSADFDGTNDYMRRVGFTGAADSKSGILSAWIRLDDGDGSVHVILDGIEVAVSFAFVRVDTTNTLRIDGDNTSGILILRLTSDTAYTAGATWLHVLASWDLAVAAGHLYINDVEDLAAGPTLTDDTIDYTVTTWTIGANSGAGFKTNGCLAEFYFAPGQFLDFSVEANRRKFISESGKPVYLGTTGNLPTGTTPLVYQHLDDTEAVANFATNRGTGGDFTITGTLDTGSTSPSD